MRVWILALLTLGLFAGLKFIGAQNSANDLPSETLPIKATANAPLSKSDLGLEKVTANSELSDERVELKIPSTADAVSEKSPSSPGAEGSAENSVAKADKRLKSVESALSEYDDEDANFEEKSISDQALLGQFRDGKMPPPPDWDEADEDLESEYDDPANANYSAARRNSWGDPDQEDSVVSGKSPDDQRDGQSLDPPGYAR